VFAGDREPMNPRLHIAMHQIVPNQILEDDPPETWRPSSVSPVWVATGTRSST
jgi:hypothetical protein